MARLPIEAVGLLATGTKKPSTQSCVNTLISTAVKEIDALVGAIFFDKVDFHLLEVWGVGCGVWDDLVFRVPPRMMMLS